MDPLIRCSEFCTSDIQEFEQRLDAAFGATEFDVSDRANLKLRSSYVPLHDLALGFWTFGTPARVKFPADKIAVLGVTLRGQGVTSSGTQSAVAAVGRPTLASAGQPREFQYGANLEKLFVRIESKALERKLAALLGAPINHRVKFELADFTSQEMLSGLLGLVEMLVHQVEQQRALLSPLALRELEEAVTVQLLFTGRHALTRQLQRKPPQTSADRIRRAEQFIEANWNHSITMEALTEVTGVSARTLFRSFIKARGYSPMVFARKVRLERAHALLSRPEATSVTSVAFACGFSSLGHFAHDYQTVFGELPSETLGRSHPLGSRSEKLHNV